MTKKLTCNGECLRCGSSCGDYQLGQCRNDKSEHYGHMLAYYHPVCESRERKQ
jgi:hypothetical protein